MSLQYEFFLKMFQSYHFKQILAISYAANFKTIMEHTLNQSCDINHIGVQVLTSSELSTLVVNNLVLKG